MPKYVGMALAVVGALVLGETAVNAGIVSTPAILIMALSGISIYAIPELVETTSVLRFIYLIVAGSLGGYGLILITAFLIIYLCSADNYGAPYLAPYSPVLLNDFQDGLYMNNVIGMVKRPEALGAKNKITANEVLIDYGGKMDKDKIYVRQICFLFGAFILPVKLITAPAIAAKYAAEDLWISALINFTIDGLAILLICRLANKFKGATVFEIVENTLGKTGKIIFAAAFYLFFTVKAYLPLIEHRNFVEIAMYETTPALWIFLPVFLLSAFFSYKGFRAAGRAADIAIWFSASGIIILAALSLSVADFSNLLPIIDVPAINILNGGVKTSIWFFDSPYLLFLLGHFKPEKKQTLKITGGYLLLPSLRLYTCSYFNANSER